MKHGNIYPPERTAVALDRFFTEPNLTALREIALRFVAQTVDEELADIGPGGIARTPVSDRVVVAVDDSGASRTALRRGATVASALHAHLLAVVVVTPADEGRAFDRERDLRENLDYAEELGAEVVRVEALRPLAGLIDVLRGRRATHLVLPYQDARTVAGFRRTSLAEEILRELPGVEVHLIAEDESSKGAQSGE